MGETKIEDMPLPALFEQARKIHTTATESGADQVLLHPHVPFFVFTYLFIFVFVHWAWFCCVGCDLFRSLWRRAMRPWGNVRRWSISWVCFLPMRPKRISAPPISSTFWYLFFLLPIILYEMIFFFFWTVVFDWLLLGCSKFHCNYFIYDGREWMTVCMIDRF